MVFFFVGDPVGSGLVASLARPGGNLTGLGGLGPGLHAKQLELLKEAVPAVRRVAIFHNPESTLHATYRREIEPAAGRLGLELVRVDLRTEQDVDAAFASVARDKAEALLILGQPFVFRVGERIAKLALEQRLPVISPILEMAHAGALMAYGSRLVDDVARVPYYLDRILKGTRPAGVAGGAAVALLSRRQSGDGARSRHRPAPGGSGPGRRGRGLTGAVVTIS